MCIRDRYIIKARLGYIEKLNKYGKEIHKEITLGKEDISFKYISSIKNLEDIKTDFYELLKKNRKKDIDKGISTTGPHRDVYKRQILHHHDNLLQQHLLL